MTALWEDQSDEEHSSRFDSETSEVGAPVALEGEVVGDTDPITDEQEREESFPLETLITPELCGMLFGIPGMVRARQTGHEWWRLDEEEKQLVGSATQPLMVHLVKRYLGEGVGMFAASVAALSVVYMPRQMREMEEQREAKENPQRTTAPPPRTSPAASAQSSGSAGAENQSSSEDFSVPFNES